MRRRKVWRDYRTAEPAKIFNDFDMGIIPHMPAVDPFRAIQLILRRRRRR